MAVKSLQLSRIVEGPAPVRRQANPNREVLGPFPSLEEEVAGTLRALHEHREPETLLHALVEWGAQTVFELSANLEKLPEEFQDALAMLVRAGLVITSGQGHDLTYEIF